MNTTPQIREHPKAGKIQFLELEANEGNPYVVIKLLENKGTWMYAVSLKEWNSLEITPESLLTTSN